MALTVSEVASTSGKGLDLEKAKNAHCTIGEGAYATREDTA